MAKKKTFHVIVRVEIETELEVQGENYEEALTKARELKAKDVVEFDTPFNDGGIVISGIYDPNAKVEL